MRLGREKKIVSLPVVDLGSQIFLYNAIAISCIIHSLVDLWQHTREALQESWTISLERHLLVSALVLDASSTCPSLPPHLQLAPTPHHLTPPFSLSLTLSSCPDDPSRRSPREYSAVEARAVTELKLTLIWVDLVRDGRISFIGQGEHAAHEAGNFITNFWRTQVTAPDKREGNVL
jgi:hypothetical protein